MHRFRILNTNITEKNEIITENVNVKKNNLTPRAQNFTFIFSI